ncbi:hypothetical protein [Actinomadura sp. HBU206391]|uniref:hypothetical protein n=1 Tax=Actinomadura sp. HBU206391 TaxID=2731692 RepID=UPI001650510D|nr:hypothetical protein [Actinomadura sp. HBU206391]MBC6458430.1 hypothetical protein [Actinomadura sp. HBU206391]
MTTARVQLPDGRAIIAMDGVHLFEPGERLRSVVLETGVGGAVAYHRSRPLFQGVRTTALSVPASTWTAVPLDSELIDTHDGHGDTTNTSRYVPPFTGSASDWYLVNGHVPFGGANGGVRIAGVRLNGGTVAEGMKITGTTAHAATTQVIDLVEIDLSNDYLELMAYQTTAGALNTVFNGKLPTFTARWACGSGNVVAHPGTPRTWTAADLISADDTTGGRIPLNVHIGDLIHWLNYPPIARITSQGTAQTIPSGSGTWTSINMPGETVDNYAGHNPVSNNSRYVCQRAGLYFVAGLVAVGETAANVGYRAARLLHTIAAGGTAIYQGGSSIPAATSTSGTALYASGWVRMAVGDYVEVQMQHTQGAALSVRTGAGDCAKLIAVWRKS